MSYKCNEGHTISLPIWNFILNLMESDSLPSNSKFKYSQVPYRCTHATFLKEKMQFTKLFKVKFTMILVKGIRLAPKELNPLFSLRVVNYMYLTHVSRATTAITITIKLQGKDVLGPKTSYWSNPTIIGLPCTRHSYQKYKGKISLVLSKYTI